MAIRHGNRTYVQLLLDPHKAALLKKEAEESGKKLTDHLRTLLYKSLQRSQPSSLYNEAQAKDEASWRESIANRVQGRMRRRAQRLENAAEDVINSQKEAC
jgi:hypothetical protein